MDWLKPEVRSKIMSKIRSTGNRSTERRLRAWLIRAGLRGWTMHGRDITPLLTNPDTAECYPVIYEHTGHDFGDDVAKVLKENPKEAIYQKVPWYTAVVDDGWKYIRYLQQGVPANLARLGGSRTRPVAGQDPGQQYRDDQRDQHGHRRDVPVHVDDRPGKVGAGNQRGPRPVPCAADENQRERAEHGAQGQAGLHGDIA